MDEFEPVEVPADPPAPVVTFALVGLNVLVFLAMFFAGVSPIAPDADSLIRFGAIHAPLVTAGQWWRVFTAAFVHVGIAHLAFNMIALFVVGPQSERRFGALPYLVLYVLAAIGSSLASLAVAPDVVSAGASGAVLGAYSGLLGLVIVRREARPEGGMQPMLTSAAILIVVNVVAPWLRQGGTTGGIDIAGHIGGLVTGFVAGIALGVATRGQDTTRRRRGTAVVAIVGLVLAAVALRRLPPVDDLQTSLRALTVVEASDVKAYNAAMGRVRLDQMKPADLADQLEHEFVPRWLGEHQKLEALRVPKRQQPARVLAMTHVANRTEMWRLAGATLRSGDPAKALDVDGQSAALAFALRDLATDLKVPTDDQTRDIAAELPRLTRVEQESVARLNIGLAKLRRSASPGEISAFARDVNDHVLAPWNAERQALRALPVPEYQQMHAKLIADYMALRADGWSLLVKGLTSADGRLMQQSSAKQKQAEVLASAMHNVKVPTLPPKAPAHAR